MRFKLINKGTCTRVRLLGEDIRKALLFNEWNESEDYDYLFVNTCSFLQSKQDESIDRINSQHIDKDKRLIIFGCLPESNKNKLKNKSLFFGRDLDKLFDFLELENRNFERTHHSSSNLSYLQKFIKFLNLFIKSPYIDYRFKQENIFHIRISQGCLGECTYCSEKFNVKLKSVLIKDIKEWFNRGYEKGFRFFALNSDDASSFGKDNGENIFGLLKALLNKKDIRVAIPEFNPKALFEKGMKILYSDKILYMTLPVQSGSQKILNKMKRGYNLNKTLKIIKKIKKKNSSLKINTHFIVGFPGETELDFRKSLDLVRSGVFDRIKVFEYSDRAGTEASSFSNKVSQEVKRKRKKRLHLEILINSLKKFDFANFLLNLGVM